MVVYIGGSLILVVADDNGCMYSATAFLYFFKLCDLDVEISVTLIGAQDYFIGNYEAFGYYRVNYERENWMNIIKALDENFEVYHLH